MWYRTIAGRVASLAGQDIHLTYRPDVAEGVQAQLLTAVARMTGDGSQIDLERTQVYGQGPTDLWMVNRDGSNPHLFKQNASVPAWSASDVPAPGIGHPLCLPFIAR